MTRTEESASSLLVQLSRKHHQLTPNTKTKRRRKPQIYLAMNLPLQRPLTSSTTEEEEQQDEDSVILNYHELESALMTMKTKSENTTTGQEDSVILNYSPPSPCENRSSASSLLFSPSKKGNSSFEEEILFKCESGASPINKAVASLEMSASHLKGGQGETHQELNEGEVFPLNIIERPIKDSFLDADNSSSSHFTSKRKSGRRSKPSALIGLSPESKQMKDMNLITMRNTLLNTGYKKVSICLKLVKNSNSRPPSPLLIRSRPDLEEESLDWDTDDFERDLPLGKRQGKRKICWKPLDEVLKFKEEDSVLEVQRAKELSSNVQALGGLVGFSGSFSSSSDTMMTATAASMTEQQPSQPQLKSCLKKMREESILESDIVKVTSDKDSVFSSGDTSTATTADRIPVPIVCHLYKNDPIERFMGLAVLPGGPKLLQQIFEEKVQSQSNRKSKKSKKKKQHKDILFKVEEKGTGTRGKYSENNLEERMELSRPTLLGKRTGLTLPPQRHPLPNEPPPRRRVQSTPADSRSRVIEVSSVKLENTNHI